MRRAVILLLAFSFSASSLLAQATVEVLPSHPSSLEVVQFRVTGSPELCWPAILVLDSPTVAGEVVTLPAHAPPGTGAPGCSPGWPQTFAVSALPAGSYSAEFRIDGVRYGAAAFRVVDPPPALELQNGKFEAVAHFVDPRNGQEGQAHAIPLTDASGSFWFFSPGNVELTIKILDGRGINGAYWVFIASMTDVAYAVEVVRRDIVCVQPPCGSTIYESPAGVNRNFIDVNFAP